MFNLIGGDFPRGTVYMAGSLRHGGTITPLRGEIEDIVVLPEKKKKVVSFECHLKNGQKFIADADPRTFQMIQVDKISDMNVNANVNLGMKKRKPIGCLIVIIFAGMMLCSLVYALLNADELGATQEGIIMNAAAIEKEQAVAVIEVLKGCGLSQIISATHDEMLDNGHFDGETGYRVSTDDISDVILYLNSDGSVYNVRWADIDFYLSGNFMGNINDYILTLDEKSNIQYTCQESIKKLLKSPKSADFPSITEWKFAKNNGIITVQSYVDAQNSFGALMRSEFQFVISKDGTITSFIFDGTEYIK